MVKVVSVAQMQAVEREADARGLSYGMMMENAGRSLAEVILKKYDHFSKRGALGLVGSGNNGGDTLVALAHLAGEGWVASAVIVRPRPADDPLLERLIETGGQVFYCQDQSDFGKLDQLLLNHALLLDGILGTGIQLPLRGDLAAVMDHVRQRVSELRDPPLVVAVDCPSGVDCDSGEAAAECIPANQTITMAAVKHGLLKFPAYSLVGNLEIVGIGLPDNGEGLRSWQQVQTFLPDETWIAQSLPPRPPDAHKGTFGTALIVAGSANYTGAALLAGQAAYRIGAGLVTLAIPEILHSPLAGQLPEATWLLLPHENGTIAASAAPLVRENLARADALLIGCGFGLADTSREFLSRLLEDGSLPPTVVDADGLRLLQTLPTWDRILPAESVLTPHPGEMSVLTGRAVSEIQSQRLETAQYYSQLWGHVVVLKGAFTIVAEPDGRAAIIPVASPALARAGTGDVLAGMIAGLRAQGVNAFPAAVAGAWIHAYAGLKAASTLGGTASVLAGDVLSNIVHVLAGLNKTK